VLHIN